MSFSFLNKRAQAEFTDRELPTESFLKSLSELDQNEKERKVIQYYGVGGIGKTRLLSELQKKVDDLHPDYIYSLVDFEDGSVREPHRALLRLRNNIALSKKQKFSSFDVAYSIYFNKRNPDISLRDSSFAYSEEAAVVSDLLSMVDGLGVSGAVGNIVKVAKKYKSKLGLNEEASRAIDAIQYMTESEIKDVLPEFFAFDLNNGKYADKIKVLFIDTYEQLWIDNISEKDRFKTDSWIRTLAMSLRKGLLVIAGREKIRWPEYEKKWSELVETHLLEKLSNEDVRTFLLSAKVSDEELINKIVNVSEGHPFYLDLCLDTLHEEGGGEPSHWPESKRELFERFAKSLSESELTLLKRLAPLSSYDDEYVRSVIRQFNIPISDEQASLYERFSFVKNQKERMSLHDLMRKSLLENTSNKLVRETRLFAVEHFSDRLSSVSQLSLDRDIILPFKEAMNQLSEIDDRRLTIHWLEKCGLNAMNVLQLRASTGPLLESFQVLEQSMHQLDWPAELQIAYADITHLVGRYKKSVEMLETQLAKMRLENTNNLSYHFGYVRKLHHSMMFRPADKVWDEALSFIKRIDQNDDPKTYGEAAFLIGGNLGAMIGDVKAAWPWLIEALRISYKARDISFRCRVYRKISDLYKIQGDIEISKKILNKAEGLASQEGATRYLNYILCAKADILRLEQLYEEAYAIILEVRRSIAQRNLNGWLAHTYLLEAATAYDKNDVPRSEGALKNAGLLYDKTDHRWGKSMVKTIELYLDEKKTVYVDRNKRNCLSKMHKTNGYKRDAELSFPECEIFKSIPALILL